MFRAKNLAKVIQPMYGGSGIWIKVFNVSTCYLVSTSALPGNHKESRQKTKAVSLARMIIQCPDSKPGNEQCQHLLS